MGSVLGQSGLLGCVSNPSDLLALLLQVMMPDGLGHMEQGCSLQGKMLLLCRHVGSFTSASRSLGPKVKSSLDFRSWEQALKHMHQTSFSLSENENSDIY